MNTELFGLAPWQMNLIAFGVVTIAILSALNPTFLKDLILSGFRKIGHSVAARNRGKHGITIASQYIPDTARLRHTHILGATGTGKTVLMEQMLFQDIDRGVGMVIIDPKGDRELYYRVQEQCERSSRTQDLHLLSATFLDESVRWNPCRLGAASELQTKWFNSGAYHEPFYAKACELGLLQAFNALESDFDGKTFSMGDLVRQLEIVSKSSKNTNMEGLFYELKNFADSEWGELFCVPRERGGKTTPFRTRREISLLDITRKNEILFVDLPTEAKAVQSSRVGKLLLQEMMLISGMRKLYPEIRNEKPFAVYVDEFDAFATEPFVTFLNKARSSNIMITIAHQTLSDLAKISPTFTGQVVGNCNNRFVFRTDHPEDAETLAKMAGTRRIIKRTFQTDNGFSTGRSSNRETEEFLFHPNVIKSLKIGQCVFSMKTEGVLTKLHIPSPKGFITKKHAYPAERGPTAFRPSHQILAESEQWGDLLPKNQNTGKEIKNGYTQNCD